MTISNQPYKGTSDWFPEEFAVRKYIFDTWRKVCRSFGFQEYLTPLLEAADVYRAKSGEDVGGKELMTLEDSAGRELAIRPEMTPSVTRMISRKYESLPKPIRYFSVANFMRGEKPQRGRNREFWQLNFDVFGSEALAADVEILTMAVEMMLAFNAPENSFVVYINDRELIQGLVEEYLNLEGEVVGEATRVLDKFSKLSREAFIERLKQLGATFDEQALCSLLEGDDAALASFFERMKDNPGAQRLKEIEKILAPAGYFEKGMIKLNPGMVRGLDYYDGMVFEVFDMNPENNRSMFGGGRYNGLGALFGGSSFPAVGCAPGDETIRLFLESWDLIPDDLDKVAGVYIPLLAEEFTSTINSIANLMRAEGKDVEVGLEVQALGKALRYAEKRGMAEVAILGAEEANLGMYKLKQMDGGDETKVELPY